MSGSNDTSPEMRPTSESASPIRPCRKTCIADIVITAQAFIRTEGLMFHESQRGLIDVGARNVPPRRKAGLVESNRSLGIGDNAVLVANHKVARRLADVDAVIIVCGMAQDPFVFFVEGVHGTPGKCDPLSQLACIRGQVDMLPGRTRRVLSTCLDGVPLRKPEVRMMGGVLAAFQDFWRDV